MNKGKLHLAKTRSEEKSRRKGDWGSSIRFRQHWHTMPFPANLASSQSKIGWWMAKWDGKMCLAARSTA